MKMRPFFLAIGFLFCGSSHGSDGALTLEEIRLPPPVPMDAEARAAGVPAVQVPAIDPNAPLAMESLPPPPVNLLSDEDSELSPRESASVDAARQWMAGSSPLSDLPAPGDGGSVVFRFGAVLPSVVCSPLYVCAIALQPGEQHRDVLAGDPVRWQVLPAVSGDGPTRRTHVVVKPTDIGLSTNLVITTDRRTYVIRLVSRRDDWMPVVAFSYPEDEAARWAAVSAAAERTRVATVLPETGQVLADLDFGYRIAGDKPRWRPLRVYSDGAKTYVEFPEAMGSTESPALVAIGSDGGQQLVNYRVSGRRYIVDRVLDEALLVVGVGRKQVKVRIEREGA